MSKYIHLPVLLLEALQYLKPEANADYIDCTLGGGGHAKAILEVCGPGGRVLGIDQDRDALKIAAERLRSFGDRAVLVKGNFKDIKTITSECKLLKISV